jgi:hypothetical protein
MPISLRDFIPNGIFSRYARQRDVPDSHGPLAKQDVSKDAGVIDGRSPVLNGEKLPVKSKRPSVVAKQGINQNQSPDHEPLPTLTTNSQIAKRLMTEEEEQAFDKLAGPHRNYFNCSEGIAALQRAKADGRSVNFDAFNRIPGVLLESNEKFPSPLFRLATNRFIDRFSDEKLGEEAYSSALTNALGCNLFDIAQKGDQGRNPIHVAALHGNAKALGEFAKHDIAQAERPEQRALNAVARDNCTPLECVFLHAPQNGVDAAKALLEAGADLSPRANAHGPIQLAVKSFRPDLVAFATTESLKREILYGKDGKGHTPHQARRDWLKDVRRRGDAKHDAIKGHLTSYKQASERRRQSPPVQHGTYEWTAVSLE